MPAYMTTAPINGRLKAHKEALASGQSAGEAIRIARAAVDPLAKWRVVYGETIPAWEKTFATKREAQAFAKKHKGFGDVIFSIAKIVPGEPPQSLTASFNSNT